MCSSASTPSTDRGEYCRSDRDAAGKAVRRSMPRAGVRALRGVLEFMVVRPVHVEV